MAPIVRSIPECAPAGTAAGATVGSRARATPFPSGLALVLFGLSGVLAAPGCTPTSKTAAAEAVEPADREEVFAAQESVTPYVPWMERRRLHRTRLTEQRSPVDGAATMVPAPPGATSVTYPSGGLQLRGWLAQPDGEPTTPRPAIVYLHNDVNLGLESWYAARPFVEAGFTAFLPTLRGENGNAGRRELLHGEVDDARAAVRWLSEQDGVDPGRIYVIGHSLGGGVASLLALDPDAGVRATADVGGIYRAQTFHHWANRPGDARLVQFDPNDDAEVSIRLFISHVRDVRLPHYAFAGRDDEFDMRYARMAERKAAEHHAPVTFVAVGGDHMGSITEAVLRFIDIVNADAPPEGNASSVSTTSTE